LIYLPPDQKVAEEKKSDEDDNVFIDPRFTHYDGEVAIEGGCGFIVKDPVSRVGGEAHFSLILLCLRSFQIL